ncbi:MAG: hypothetical protein IPN71_01380 [Fibrobacteres bacterium]|nr:hypothetical protein [Fibrobacterota bacterium]
MFIGPLGWGIEEKAGENWPPRLTLFSWMLIPVFLCLHERMASFAIPAREIPVGNWQFLWYGIPHALRFQEGLTLFLYPVVGLVLLAGAVAWVRWKWRQHQDDRRILNDLGDEPLEAFWRDDRREDLRNLRSDEERIVKKLVGPRAILFEVGAGWLALHAFPFAILWGLSWEFQGSIDFGAKLLSFIGMGELFAVLFWLFDLGRLSKKISGEFRRKSDAEVFIGSQVIRYRSKIHRPEDIRDLLEEGRFYHVVADTHGEDSDEYSIGIVANHVGVAEDPRRMPLWTLWSLVMSPTMWLLFSRSKDFQLQDGLEGLLRMGLTPKGVLLGGFEIPFVTSLSGALVVVAFLGLSGPFAWGFIQGLPWAFRKWKARDPAEEEEDLV